MEIKCHPFGMMGRGQTRLVTNQKSDVHEPPRLDGEYRDTNFNLFDVRHTVDLHKKNSPFLPTRTAKRGDMEDTAT
jgi:hypothetical protein